MRADTFKPPCTNACSSRASSIHLSHIPTRGCAVALAPAPLPFSLGKSFSLTNSESLRSPQ
eukprot:2774086-Pyramimonas_sp.AAC.1